MAAVQADGLQHLHRERVVAVIAKLRVHHGDRGIGNKQHLGGGGDHLVNHRGVLCHGLLRCPGGLCVDRCSSPPMVVRPFPLAWETAHLGIPHAGPLEFTRSGRARAARSGIEHDDLAWFS
jgi:hypothetical protein